MIRKCVNTIKYGTAKARAIVLLSLLFGIGTVGAIVCAIVFRQILFIFAAVVCVFVVITLAQTLVIQGGVVEDAKNAETQDTKRSKRTKPQDADNEAAGICEAKERERSFECRGRTQPAQAEETAKEGRR